LTSLLLIRIFLFKEIFNMAFMFGRGRKATQSANAYTGPGMRKAGRSIDEGYVKGYGLGQTRRSARASRMPGEHSSIPKQILGDTPISQRATTSTVNQELYDKVSAARARPNFGTIAEQRAASAERVAARGGNMSRTTPTFPSISEQRAANILSGQRDARGYQNGFMRGQNHPKFGTIAEQRAASAERVAARGGNMTGTRPAFGTIAEQRAASAERVAARGGNMTGTRPAFGTIAEQRAASAERVAARGGNMTRRAPIGAGESTVTRTIVRDLEGAGGEIARGGKTTAAEGVMKTFKNNKALFIGAGVAVGAYALMNRRGKGTSSGRAGMTRH
jgi:hypothetical protein